MNCCAFISFETCRARCPFMSFETSMLGSLYLCLVQNVDFGFDAPYVDIGLAAPSCHLKQRRQVRWPSSCRCWSSCSTRQRSVLHTLMSFDMQAWGFFCPCCSTWRHWAVDTFALSDTSGLGYPDVFERGGAGFGSFGEWGVVVSWRGCVKDRGILWIINALGCTLCRVVLCLVAALYTVSYSCTPFRSALHHVELSTGDTPCRLTLWLLFGLLGCRLVAGLSFGPHLAVVVVVWPSSLLFGAFLWALG